MKKQISLFLDMVIIFVIVAVMSVGIFCINQLGFSIDISTGLVAIISAFIGIVLTTAITFLLLSKQSEYDARKEHLVSQFNKKQETYYQFLNTLETDVITLIERSIKDNNGLAYRNVVILENLIFQFGYLRVHMDNDKFLEIISIVSNIFEKYRKVNLSNSYKQEILELEKHRSDEFNGKLYYLYLDISINLFKISQILHEDLYGKNKNGYFNSNENIHTFLEACGLRKNIL